MIKTLVLIVEEEIKSDSRDYFSWQSCSHSSKLRTRKGR